MKYRKLGKSELMISEISLGCMSISCDDKVAGISLIHQAIDLGINYFDTADLYDRGTNETILGKAVKGNRDQVILATKVGNQWKDGETGWHWNASKDYILQAVEDSLRRLQTDYIDLYQLHGGMIEDSLEDVVAAFELLQSQGKIRYYGISSIRPNVIREYVKRSNIVSVMMQYSLADRRPEEEILNLLSSHDIGVLVRGSLAQGILVDKPAKDYLGHKISAIQQAQSIVQTLVKVNRTAAQTVIQFVMANPAITSDVVGVSSIEQLNEVICTGESDKLTESDMEILYNALPAKLYEQHK